MPRAQIVRVRKWAGEGAHGSKAPRSTLAQESTVGGTAGAVMTMLELTDWTKTARVKALIKEIEKRCGVESEPCTQTTRRLVALMVGKTIRAVCSRGSSSELNEVLESRTMLLLVLELLAGLRVGEATTSGDLHGLEANKLCFLSPASCRCSSAVDPRQNQLNMN